MLIGVPVETYPAERRVALVPSVVAGLAKAGLEVLVQQGAGQKAGFFRFRLPESKSASGTPIALSSFPRPISFCR